ncbi:hypothetical protein CIPAW_15G123500 [Carya illinoinensis]|uniref:Uncharacterized protein n=1 Tax=Carya illinoinensis TaxID=32201 RepID=A0A8T1N6P3_CARIL|nr:hypothetical protein CIPAW_15G123500 [Carya illinoinensis]
MTWYKIWVEKLFEKNHQKSPVDAVDCGFMKIFAMYLKKIREQTKLKAY